MTKSVSYTRAVLFSRPAGRRRIEVFSPKMARRLSLGGYDAYRTWLVIEANPRIITFCERPTYVDGPRSPVIDFWVQLSDDPDGEFWIIEGLERPPSVPDKLAPQPFTHLHSLPVRYINRADLLSWATPISNWARILPFLISHRRYRDKRLEQYIMSYLNRDESLDAVVGCFHQRDETTVQAALFQLLAEGRVISPDLAYAPLDGSTRFHRLPVVLAPS